MKKSIKILLWSIVIVLILGIAAGAFWWLRKPQIITFDSGDKLTLLAVDLMQKLNIHNAAGLTRYAICAGVIESGIQFAAG
jgi:flagellar basal body-associated protein FliL